MKKLLVVILFIASLFFIPSILGKTKASQNIRFGNGYYINLMGAGADIDGNIQGYSGEANCNTETGICYPWNRYNGQIYNGATVYRYVCQGKVTNCDYTYSPTNVLQSSQGYYQYIDTNIGCDRTIQLDVFDNQGSLKGYMTWYSGQCSSYAPSNTITTCNGRVISQATLENELRGAGYPGPWGDINQEIAAFNRAACPGGNVLPQVQPISYVTTCNGRVISKDTLESELKGAGYPGPWGDIQTELSAFNRAACSWR